MIIFYVIVFFIIAQRLFELYIANKNEQWMIARGGFEIGSEHYKLFILLHVSFFISLLIENHSIYAIGEISFNIYFFLVFLLAQIGRMWCIVALGRFWNTKIIVLPNVLHIKKGPYKYIKHPNYVIVFIELRSEERRVGKKCRMR